MVRRAIVLAFLVASWAMTGGCAKNQSANAKIACESPPCAERQTAGPGMGPGMMGSGMMGSGMMGTGDSCPMGVAGTTVQEASTADGAEMRFKTSGDVAELRKRARAMAAHMDGSSGGVGMHGMMMGAADGGSPMMMGGGTGGGMHGMMGSSDGGMGMMGGAMPPMRAQADDVEGGARLRMTPVDPTRLAEMRQHVMQRAQMMNQARGCPMMVAGE